MMNRDLTMQVRLDRFEGPLDLLLHLIHENELDISQISLTKITDPYLRMVKYLAEVDFEGAAEFLLMAATLIYWKSKSLLPKDPSEEKNDSDLEDGILTPEQILEQLRLHKLYLQTGKVLQERPLLGVDVFKRANPKPPLEKLWKTPKLNSLILAMQEIKLRSRAKQKVLRKETVSIASKIDAFRSKLPLGLQTALTTLMTDVFARPERVVTFLTALELGRLKRLELSQIKVYDEIYVKLIDSLDTLDAGLVTGFDMGIQKELETTQEPST